MGLFGGNKKEKTKMFFNSIKGLNINENERIELIKSDDSLIINKALSTVNLETIKYKDIISINRYNEQEIVQKDKSVIGRAIVGGVLTGGIGAVVGGMSGVGSKSKKGKMRFFVNIDYFKNNTKMNIIIEDYILIGSEKFILDIQSKVSEFKNQVEENTNTSNELDIPDQIRKLSELNKDGIISDSEFELKKTELLSKM